MKNQLFSMIIIPDNGAHGTNGSFNTRFITLFFGSLIIIFFSCLCVIAGYHIKIGQEKKYKEAVLYNKQLIKKFHIIERRLNSTVNELGHLRNDDTVYRFVAMINIIDDTMYEAGIGGHTIVDDTDFSVFDENLKNKLIKVSYDFISMENRLTIQEKSFMEIENNLQRNYEIIDNTPTIFPTVSTRLTSIFGWRTHPVTGKKEFHQGVDLSGKKGQPIRAAAGGVVIGAQDRGKLGKCVTIKHKFGYKTLYGHLDNFSVKVGQEIKKRDVIGTIGMSGRSTGIHLHYGVYLLNKPQDPMNYLVI